MATLTVWEFPDADAAEKAAETPGSLARQELIQVHDAAIVTWPADKKRPKTRQLHNLVGAGALGGAFWGMLFGLIFFVPFLGAAIGAGIGALTGSLRDVGIDDGFIRSVAEKVTPGTSALFVLSSNAVIDRVRDAFAGTEGQLIETNLSSEEEARLREVFTED